MTLQPDAGTSRHDTTTEVHEQHEGGWRASVPLPFYGFLHVRCQCGERFWNWRGGKRRSWGTPEQVYQLHYRREHIPREDIRDVPDAGTSRHDTTTAKQRKHLVLHIEIPGFYADDLDQCAGYLSEPDPPRPEDRLYVVTEEWMRSEVGITLVSLPGEKCMSDDFEVRAFTGRIVGADTCPASAAGRDAGGEQDA